MGYSEHSLSFVHPLNCRFKSSVCGDTSCKLLNNIVHLQIFQVLAALLDDLCSNLIGQPCQILTDLALASREVMLVELLLRSMVLLLIDLLGAMCYMRVCIVSAVF